MKVLVQIVELRLCVFMLQIGVYGSLQVCNQDFAKEERIESNIKIFLLKNSLFK